MSSPIMPSEAFGGQSSQAESQDPSLSQAGPKPWCAGQTTVRGEMEAMILGCVGWGAAESFINSRFTVRRSDF